ncbi:hypothetical protein L615_007000000230 [Nocardioides sp. J9]|uniref:hypothetical protein n=1 Tax=Nocardioides sp. J9 TaxID=935844 RepID=UPI0011A6A2D3|nr:hypothetical protein [Nocardioides sp. J9]TWG92512.1 hypothetical protein L615_007000000230 [Nocardioides sp. J9]
MATGPLGTDPEHAALSAERDALARRCAEAEARVAELEAELAEARASLAAQADDSHLSLFDGTTEDRLVGDGSDPRVLSLVLGATAVVAGMVTLLTILNGKIVSPFGVVMIALTVGLAWGAARTRVVPVEVSVVRGMVYVQQGELSYRFDLRRPETDVQVVGEPGSPTWAVRFGRRGLDPFVIDASMVDSVEFTGRLREYRPEL